MIDYIPEELKKCSNWVCYQLIEKKKIPKNPLNGKNLIGTIENWGVPFDVACKAIDKYGFTGLGFVFKSDNPYCGIDLDKCVNSDGINKYAKDVIKRCNSYSEFSPSATGIHILVKNTNFDKVLLKTKYVEVYSTGRFFTITGNRITKHSDINVIDLKSIFNIKDESPAVLLKESLNEELTQEQMINIINELKVNNEKFKKLWEGNHEEYDSHSEADLALCSILSYQIKDKNQIDEAFRMSKLFRPKWDRSVGQGKTYGQLTIEKALIHGEELKIVASNVIEIDDFISMDLPEVKTIMKPWLTYGSTHMIYSIRGVGKTYFALSISMAVAYNTNFGEWEIETPVNVLYVDGEMLPQQMIERINGLRPNLKEKQKRWFILSSGLNLQQGKPAINIAKERWQNLIFKEIIEKDIKIVFLDNISALTPGVEENESTSWDAISQWMIKIKQTGCAVVLIHHAGKKGTQRGTSSREDILDTVVYLKSLSVEPIEGVNVNVIFEKSRHLAGYAVTSFNFKLISNPGSDAILWDIGSPNNKKDVALKMICDGRSYSEIKKMTGISKGSLTKYKYFALEKGWIKEDEEGKFIITPIGKVMLGDEGFDF